jgi:hypothetical protein
MGVGDGGFGPKPDLLPQHTCVGGGIRFGPATGHPWRNPRLLQRSVRPDLPLWWLS